VAAKWKCSKERKSPLHPNPAKDFTAQKKTSPLDLASGDATLVTPRSRAVRAIHFGCGDGRGSSLAYTRPRYYASSQMF
jgi:hypothetical protein